MLEVSESDDAMDTMGRTHGIRNVIPVQTENALAAPRQMPASLRAHGSHAGNNTIEFLQGSAPRSEDLSALVSCRDFGPTHLAQASEVLVGMMGRTRERAR